MSNSDYPPEGSPIRQKRSFGDPDILRCNKCTTYVLNGGRVIRSNYVIVPLRQDHEEDQMNNQIPREGEYGFWCANRRQHSQYGQVCGGWMLRRCHQNIPTSEGEIVVNWEVTDLLCAIKCNSKTRMSQNHGSVEDPRGEIAAMQYLMRYQQHHSQQENHDVEEVEVEVEEHFRLIQEQIFRCNVMMPLAVYEDNTNIYCIMPYVDGAELFDARARRGNFTKEEARYIMRDVMNGLETLQRAGICHRDISLENLMTNSRGTTLIIDLGMCLKIPYQDDVEGGGQDDYRDCRERQRCLIEKDVFCGKPIYMSPEICCQYETCFDGHAVDIWALGPILYALVTGRFPFQYPNIQNDHLFRLICYYERLEELNSSANLDLGLSQELVDLLQKMFRFDPRTRLSLEQIRDDPWMNGPRNPPSLPPRQV